MLWLLGFAVAIMLRQLILNTMRINKMKQEFKELTDKINKGLQ